MNTLSSVAHAPNAEVAFQLKGGAFTATVMELQTPSLDALRSQLQGRSLDAAAWLKSAPVILSVEKLGEQLAAVPELVALCRASGVSLVAVRAEKTQQALLSALDLPVLSSLRRDRGETVFDDQGRLVPVQADVVESPPQMPSSSMSGTQIITQPVRGGQQIYAAGDLIVLAPVSAGAEVMADGNIHCYGPLRGRALAGVQGNTEAQVFCQMLEAELVSVAGRYLVADELRSHERWRKAARVALAGDALSIVEL